jgi:magnesium-transporting ATPase (P-type)
MTHNLIFQFFSNLFSNLKNWIYRLRKKKKEIMDEKNKEPLSQNSVKNASQNKKIVLKKEEKKFNLKREFLLTFSNEKSLISSKKLERGIVFYTFLFLSIFFIIKKFPELDSFSFIEILAVWLAYGGYNTYQNYRDMKNVRQDRKESQIEEESEEFSEDPPEIEDKK